MIRRILRFTGYAVLALTAISCTFDVPKKIQAKGSPTVYAPLGNKSFEVSKYLSTDDIASMFETGADSSSGMKVFKYTDPAEQDVLKFMVYYPVTSYDLDFAKTLESLNLDESLSAPVSNQSFTIPQVGTTLNENVEVNFQSTLITTINSTMPALTLPVVEGVPVDGKIIDVPFSISGYDTVTIGSGSLNLMFSALSSSGFDTASINSVSLMDVSDPATPTLVSTSVSGVNLLSGGTISIPLAGAELPSDLSLQFSVTLAGGVLGTTHDVDFSPAFDSNTFISGASGIDINETVSIPQFTVPAITEDFFVNAVIGTGSLTVGTGAFPAGWTGFTKSLDLQIAQTGGLNLDPAPSENSVNLTLDGQSINKNEILVNGSVQILATDASFSGLSQGSPLTVTCTTAFSVDEFTSVSVQGDMFTIDPITQDLPETMLAWVDSIAFNKIGIAMAFKHDLPVTNTFEIDVTSTALGIISNPQGITAVVGDFETSDASTVEFSRTGFTLDVGTDIVAEPGAVSALDVGIEFILNGYSPGDPGNLTLKNLQPGATYHFNAEPTFIADWQSVSISPQDSFSGVFPESTEPGIDLSPISDYLGNDIDFAEIPVYLYIGGFDLENLSFQTVLDVDYTGKPVGSALFEDPLTLAEEMPDFSTNTTGEFSGSIPYTPATIDLANPINARPTDMRISYSLTPGAVTVFKEDLSTSTTLEVAMILVFPFKMVVTNPDGAEISLGEDTEMTEDIFGRTSATAEDEDMDMLLDSLASMNLALNINNSILHGTLELEMSEPISGFSQILSLTSGSQIKTLSIDRADILKIKNTVPFIPDITLRVKSTNNDNSISLDTDGDFTIGVTVSAVTDFDQTFDLQGGI